MFDSQKESLRQYDLDQVMRVERGSLLSVPHRGAPRSIVRQLYAVQANLSIQKSADSALPFFFHLELAGTDARGKREEISEQTIELDGFFDHGEMT